MGFVAGAAVALVALSRPLVDLPEVKPITSKSERGEIVESFFSNAPADAVALTHSGKLPFAAFPQSIALFSEPAIERGLALLVRLRNAAGEVIGFASELEVHPAGREFRGDVTWKTDWTVVLPGRGALFLHQQERSGEVGRTLLEQVLATRQPWQGDVTFQTSAGPGPQGRGIIVGGTGEFASDAGGFVEIDRVTRLTPEGALEGTFELRLFRDAR